MTERHYAPSRAELCGRATLLNLECLKRCPAQRTAGVLLPSTWHNSSIVGPVMASDDLCLLDLVEIGRRVQARQLSSVEVTQAVLDRIARLDGRLKSYVTLTADLALAEAGAG
jgi:hypothetical protein